MGAPLQTPEAKEKMAELRKVVLAANSIIFEEGDVGDAAYVIRSGSVEIRKGTRSDNPVSLGELERGDVVGELALFDDRPRMATAIASSEVELIRMSKEEFVERLSTLDPAIKHMVLKMVMRARLMADELTSRKSGEDWAKWKITS
jgi:CRP-like cAMP-binding protein